MLKKLQEVGKYNVANPKVLTVNPKPILNLNLKPFFMAGLWFLLFTSPFLKGLFFQPELLTAQIITAIAFAFCVYDQVLRREVDICNAPLDRAILALVIAYALSLITAVHMRQAIGGLLIALSYFMVYWMSFRAVRDEKALDRLLIVVYAAGVGVATVGLGAAAGVINFPGAVAGDRIASTFQYPNTLAIFLGAVNVIGLGMSVKSERLVPKILYAAANLLLITVILGTQSRGGWVIYPLAIAGFISLIPLSYRWRAVYHLAIFLGCGLATARVFYNNLGHVKGPVLLQYLIIGLGAAVFLQVLYHFVAERLNREEVSNTTRRLVATGGIIYIGAVLAVFLWYAALATPFSPILTGKMTARAQSINAYDPSFTQRLEYDRDALRIVRDYPVTGAGGGGWNALYHRYASDLYWSTETHNHFFQTWVEAGTIGVIVLLTIWVFFFRLLFKFRRLGGNEGLAVSTWTAGVAAITIGLHSAFDFDLSFAAIGVTLFALFGTVRGAADIAAAEGSSKTVAFPSTTKLALTALIGTLAAAALFYPGFRFYSAGMAGAEGAQALAAKHLEKARGFYEQANRLDPFTASYAVDLAQIWAAQAVAEDDAIAHYRAIELAREAAKAEPFNASVRSTLINVYSVLKEYDLMAAEAETLQKANPLLAPHYEILARARFDAAQSHLKLGKENQARKYLREIVKMPRELPPAISEPTPVLNLVVGEASYLLGDFQEAEKFLNLAHQGSKEKIREANLWLAVTYTRLGQKEQSDAILTELIKEDPKAIDAYQEILALPRL